ncbi:O-antigen ligase [uncultured Algibacter sp.]|uniref:O-antigen ligase family protein n=1 Tax=uncultured Algibacter sp. TaxID=298659 RepID=UPI0026037121|nr:O-antigen ligase family protein [uncultured Algibacter sp.]
MSVILDFIKNKKALLGICIFVFSISFDPDWSSKSLVFMIIIGLFTLDFNRLFLKKEYLFILLITLVYVLINMNRLSTIHFSNLATLGLCILFYLLIFQTNYKFINLKIVTFFFTFGVFFVGIVNLLSFLFETRNFSIFNAWKDFSIFDIHKIYYGSFVNLSFLMLIYLFLKKQVSFRSILFLIPFIIVLLLFTGSVSNMFIFALLCTLYISYNYFLSYYKKIYLLILLGPVLILCALSTSYGKEFMHEIEGERSRVRNFGVNRALISKSPIYGYGIGNELYIMQEARSKKSWEYKNSYNAHNQYFEYLLGGGAIYLILSLFPLLYINIKDRKLNQNLFANGFTVILGYIYLIESFEQRHHGRMFFAFFITLIILDMHRDKLK